MVKLLVSSRIVDSSSRGAREGGVCCGSGRRTAHGALTAPCSPLSPYQPIGGDTIADAIDARVCGTGRQQLCSTVVASDVWGRAAVGWAWRGAASDELCVRVLERGSGRRPVVRRENR